MRKKRGTPRGMRPFVLETQLGAGLRRRTQRSRYLYLDRAIIAAVSRQLQGARHSSVIALRSGKERAFISGVNGYVSVKQRN